MTYDEYLKSDRWRLVAEQAKKRAGWKCQLCNARGPLDAHHRTYDRLGDEFDADVVCLCRQCHQKFHDKEQDDREVWLNAVKAERPMYWGLFVCQAMRLLLPNPQEVLLLFGRDADDVLIAKWTNRQVAGRWVRSAKFPIDGGTLVVWRACHCGTDPCIGPSQLRDDHYCQQMMTKVVIEQFAKCGLKIPAEASLIGSGNQASMEPADATRRSEA